MKIVILGGGESGVGAAILAKEKGYSPFVSDAGAIEGKHKLTLESKGIPYEEFQHSENKILPADEIVKSPGIPDSAAIIQKIQEAGIQMIGEIEFAFRFLPGNAFTIGITGTNGKTTTTTLTHHLLTVGGIEAALVGNVGKSFAWAVAKNQYKTYVIELSSFQLDSIIRFRPNIGALLNITPDHLDRYGNDMSKYVRSKMRILMNQSKEDHFFFNASDERIAAYQWGKNIQPKVYPIMESMAEQEVIKVGNSTFYLSGTVLRGKHNRLNALFALGIATQFGIDDKVLQAGLRSFRNVEHRMESVGVVDGIEFINDSKATNVEAVYHAIEALEQPIIWIAGGQDKGNNYHALDRLARQKVKALVCLGVDNHKLLTHFKNIIGHVIDTNNMEWAVQEARQIAEEGDIILLSPACASFDLFKNFEDRGNQFKSEVQKLSS